MSKVLIVEDDEFKRDNIADCVSKRIASVDLFYAKSIVSSLQHIEANELIDLVILDMSLPTYDVGPDEPGGRPQGFGGLTVMQHLDALDRRIPVLVVTQFLSFEQGDEIIEVDDLKQTLVDDYPDLFIGLIQYSGGSNNWKDELIAKLEGALFA